MNKGLLIEGIIDAFQDTKLNEGIGIYEAESLDNYYEKDKISESRKKTESVGQAGKKYQKP